MVTRLTKGVIRPLSLTLLLVALLASAAAPALAAPAANGAFQQVWARTDKPVADLGIARTWMWGPAADTGALQEAYAEAPGGMRTVQYFDKSRMEINDPNGDPNSPWYVTNGLLANELISGDMQFGDATFRHFDPAAVDVAGDPSDPNAPTYASFSGLLNAPPAATGSVVEQQLNRDGSTQLSSTAAGLYHVIIAAQSSATNHSIALPFWNFMNSTGLVYENGGYQQDQLFLNPYYATGYPISEPYWVSALVGGTLKDVLVQCFQRRCLTYTPSNSPGWQVEAGNIGQHYYYWRYTILGNPQPIQQLSPSVAVSAWVSSPNPLHNEDVTVYGKILDAGQPVAGVALTATWHFQSGDVACSGTTDTSGVGYCQRNVGSAEADVPVPIDVSFSYQGATYTAQTSLTPTGQLPSNVGFGVWVSNTSPKQHTTVTVYGQLTQNGNGVAGVPMTATWSFDSATQICTGTTNAGGLASCSLNIGNATVGYQVEIWVSLDFAGHAYTARTSITPSS